MSNRLQLNFQLQTEQERAEFVNAYINSQDFQSKPLTPEELETIANYMLWGKDENGKNAAQRKEVQIETKNRTWDRQDTDSLDAMMESPTFNEAALRKPSEARTRIHREVFDRAQTLKQCPDHMLSIFKELFHRIDTLELGINFYEIAHGRRKEPPRAGLLAQFEKGEIEDIRESAEKWKQYFYLKQRHLLVELRREQFTLRDSFIERHARKTAPEPEVEPANLDFEAEIPVYPLGLVNSPIGRLVFKELEKLNPTTYSDAEIEKAVKFYWEKKQDCRPQLFFDFTQADHVYELFGQLEELEESVETLPIESNLGRLLATLKYYVDLADLTEIQREILDLKVHKIANQQISEKVNKKYKKSYTANYISTIFCQKIVPHINAAAELHAEIVCNLCFPENFKKCNGCGKMLLVSADNFVRKNRAKDGFANKCKICDRNERQSKKVVK